MRVGSSTLAVSLLVALAACDDPGASLEITDARASRAPDKRVVVEVDLLAQERLGGSIGTYCTRVTFAGQTSFAEQCHADLHDGDTKTLRFTSEGDIAERAVITINARLARGEVGRDLEAPRH